MHLPLRFRIALALLVYLLMVYVSLIAFRLLEMGICAVYGSTCYTRLDHLLPGFMFYHKLRPHVNVALEVEDSIVDVVDGPETPVIDYGEWWEEQGEVDAMGFDETHQSRSTPLATSLTA